VVVSKTGSVNVTALGSYTITYTALDGGGNTASVSRTVDVVDRIAPTISLLGGAPYNHVRYKPYVEPGYQISDNYYPAAQVTVTVDDSRVINHKPGFYEVYYTVSDPSGNTNKVSRIVFVTETGEVGLDELDAASKLKVFPNPSSGIVNVMLGEGKFSELNVYNMVGAKVYSRKETQAVSSGRIDLSSLQNGIYLIIVESDGGRHIARVQVTR
jgi:hypothetical protein